VARGPATGPLVVGEFRAMRLVDAEDDRHAGNNDLDRLIDRNVKG